MEKEKQFSLSANGDVTNWNTFITIFHLQLEKALTTTTISRCWFIILHYRSEAKVITIIWVHSTKLHSTCGACLCLSWIRDCLEPAICICMGLTKVRSYCRFYLRGRACKSFFFSFFRPRYSLMVKIWCVVVAQILTIYRVRFQFSTIFLRMIL